MNTNCSSPLSNVTPSQAQWDKKLIQALAQSQTYLEYQNAFQEMTGMPLSLCPADAWNLPHHGKKWENEFCNRISSKSKACVSCLKVQEKLRASSTQCAETVNCAFGLSDTAVPIRTGNRLIGYLQTGQVFRSQPESHKLDATLKSLKVDANESEKEELHKAYMNTPVVSPRKYQSIVKLLDFFSVHLAQIASQITIRQEHSEPDFIRKAREYIHQHQHEDLSLGQVARTVHTSTFYFCKMFRKHTGVNFTDYLSRTRIEKAKNLLLNQQMRISEIAYEVGFQSLTHFNRVFKKIIGESPSKYRTHLAGIHP